MKNKEDDYFKERFQTLRQILRAWAHTCSLKHLETKQQGVLGADPPDANEKVRFFKFFRLKNEEEARFFKKKFQHLRQILRDLAQM